ncbi:MAG: class II aldolase/adducin family protein, partial [Candidatus Desulforudis sp.]|nr:class II aldolase/adducin family protein [Desulforudis sp.]
MSLVADKAREQLVRLGTKIVEAGLVVGTWGNFSCRVLKDNAVVITPSGMDYTRINICDMVIVDMDGQVLDGERKPSTELALHLSVYQARPDVLYVIHTHSPYASAMAALRMPIPPLLEDMAGMIGGAVPVAEYAQAGSRTLAKATAQALETVNAVLLANHGVVGVGRTVEEAFQICQLVEKSAQVYILARSVGNPVVLSDEEVARLRKSYQTSYGQTGGQKSAAFNSERPCHSG